MAQKRYPRGHFVAIGIAIGIPLGMPIGFALGNAGIGPAIGAALGVPIGIALEKQKNPNPRELTKEEARLQKRNLTIALGIGALVAIAIVLAYFLVV